MGVTDHLEEDKDMAGIAVNQDVEEMFQKERALHEGMPH